MHSSGGGGGINVINMYYSQNEIKMIIIIHYGKLWKILLEPKPKHTSKTFINEGKEINDPKSNSY